MVHSSWLNERVYNENISLLEDLNLRNFIARYTVGTRGNLKNKLYSNQKSNYIVIFYLKVISIYRGKDYTTYYKYTLIKFKYWFGNKTNVYSSIENIDKAIIKL